MSPDKKSSDVSISSSTAKKGARAVSPFKASPAEANVSKEDQVAVVKPRLTQYLIAPRHGSNLTPLMTSDLTSHALENMEGVRILKRIRPSGLTTFSTLGGGADVFVAETTVEKGLELSQTASRDLIVEPNSHLIHLATTPQVKFSTAQPDLPPPVAVGVPIEIQVRSFDASPISHVALSLYDRFFHSVVGETDTNGRATLTLYGATPETILALYVKPASAFWERWILNPSLNTTKENFVVLQPLESFPNTGFQGLGKSFLGWGQKLMGLEDALSAGITGKGIRVAIIDSGCDNTHPVLTHIKSGKDFTGDSNPFIDRLGHGTHCAGVIAGSGDNGIKGFVPDAEVHILKLFPGGRFDDLISALTYCIDNRIDVVNCSLGSSDVSEAVHQAIEQARQAGVAVIVAAGNSSGDVQFPAQLPNVLSVAAIGETSQFPPDTYHAQTVPPSPSLTTRDIFAAKFSCHGPEIKVCGPGVAIISTVPGSGYAAWDGTSMAAPHLTGMAALALSSHPEIRSATRNASRVDTLFRVLMNAAKDLSLPRDYEGVGIPAFKNLASAGPSVRSQNELVDLTRIITQTVISVINNGGLGAEVVTAQPFRSIGAKAA